MNKQPKRTKPLATPVNQSSPVSLVRVCFANRGDIHVTVVSISITFLEGIRVQDIFDSTEPLIQAKNGR